MRLSIGALVAVFVAACSADPTAPPEGVPAYAAPADAAAAPSAEPAARDASAPPADADAAADAATLPTCPCYAGDGDYCATGVAAEAKKRRCAVPDLGANAQNLYACARGAWKVAKTCKGGCYVADTGVADGCRSTGEYLLPWSCGKRFETTQGIDGDICNGDHGGDHVGGQKDAFDFGLPAGTTLLAVRAGVVTAVGNAAPPGAPCNQGCPYAFGSAAFESCCNACLTKANWVNVQHADGTVATYWHLSRVDVAVGKALAQGDRIGLSGTSGCSTGPHLHFQVMGACPTGYCASVPMAFAEAGKPACGVFVTSSNACK